LLPGIIAIGAGSGIGSSLWEQETDRSVIIKMVNMFFNVVMCVYFIFLMLLKYPDIFYLQKISGYICLS
jgi:hypothetical protein